jgi:hypothetical protein
MSSLGFPGNEASGGDRETRQGDDWSAAVRMTGCMRALPIQILW